MTKRNQIRIIAGTWRGRKLNFPDNPSLRPTSDRIRETLFNWLMPYIREARCLDLFAGSGALGFEAISRGASEVVLLEKDQTTVQFLENNAKELQAMNVKIVQVDALEWLKEKVKNLKAQSNSTNQKIDHHQQVQEKENQDCFDIVFVDPPYTEDKWSSCFSLLEEGQFLKNNALIYFEANADLKTIALPSHWQMIKEKRAGNVFYALAKRGSRE
jgi:16S rRNA (guanine966-N2)-methyltransferase